MPSTKHIGDRGEDIAVSYLEARGYRIMDRNYRFERNEVDVVCFQPDPEDEGGEIVFVEVKTRSSLSHGAPDAAVTEEKKSNVLAASQAWLYERQLEGAPARFDVVGVLLKQDDDPAVEHFENAFLG